MEDKLLEKTDFRDILYSKYLSTFKSITAPENKKSMQSDYALYRKMFLPLLKDFPKNAKIIELGCGSGYKLNFLLQEGYGNLYGIDISEEQIHKLISRGIKGEVANILDFIKKNTERYDIVLAFDIIEHFGKEELIDLFEGFYSLLKENGILVIHTPNGQSPFALKHIYGDLTHLTIFNPSSLTQILSISGFKKINFFETGPRAKNAKGVIRLILWKTVRIVFGLLQLIESGDNLKILTQDFICTARK